MTNRRIIYTTGGLFHCYLGLPGYPRVSMFWKTGGIMASWMDNRIWYGYGSTSLFLVSCYWLTVTDPDPSQTHPPVSAVSFSSSPFPSNQPWPEQMRSSYQRWAPGGSARRGGFATKVIWDGFSGFMILSTDWLQFIVSNCSIIGGLLSWS